MGTVQVIGCDGVARGKLFEPGLFWWEAALCTRFTHTGNAARVEASSGVK